MFGISSCHYIIHGRNGVDSLNVNDRLRSSSKLLSVLLYLRLVLCLDLDVTFSDFFRKHQSSHKTMRLFIRMAEKTEAREEKGVDLRKKSKAESSSFLGKRELLIVLKI